MKRLKQIYSDQFTKSIKNTKEKSGFMKNENVLIKSESFSNTVQGLSVEFRSESWPIPSFPEPVYASRAFCVTMNRELSIEKFNNIDGVEISRRMVLV